MQLRKNLLRQLFVSILFFVFISAAHAQLSIQVSPGIMNYGGDIQNKVYTFQQSNFSISGALIYSINKFSIKGSLTLGKVRGDDVKGTNNSYRNLSFYSTIHEANLLLQYDFFRLDDNMHKVIPYAFAGFGVFHFNPYTNYDSQKVYLRHLGTEGQGLAAYPDKKPYALTQLNIPYGVGVKYKLSEQFLIGIEFCSRFLFTDYLDDVSGTYPDENELFKGRGQLAVNLSFRGDEIDPSRTFPQEGAIRGNPKHNDNYYTTAITFTYVFPSHTSLFKGNGLSAKRSKQLDCPKTVF